MNKRSFKTRIWVLLGFLTLGITGSGFAFSQTQDAPADQFAAYDQTSEMTVDHGPLTQMLKTTVLPMGRSPKRLGWKGETEQFFGTRFKKTVNSSPSRYENNRLMIHAFRDEHGEFFKAYQDGLERLSVRRPLKTWNRDEQLAFWLNLYNVVVLNKIIDKYPLARTKKLRDGPGSFWHEKSTEVGGVPLSLVDIENIVISNWTTPLVIYGFWQGSIGGPRLHRDAYTSENVWELLEKNASEFVNSNRGVIPRKDNLEVSLFYEWTKGAFRNSDASLFTHILSLTDTNFMGDITHLSNITYKYYDWQVADLVGGSQYTGPKFAAGIRDDLFRSFTGSSNAVNLLPPQAIEMFEEMSKEQAIPDLLRPVITTEECAPGEPCEANPDGN